MRSDKPKVFESAMLAWNDVFRAMAAMPVLTVAAVGLGLVFGVADIMLPHWVGPLPSAIGALAATIAGHAIWGFFLTPLYLAIHRYIILGEVASGYALAVGQPRFLRFYLFTLALYALWQIPALLLVAFGRNGVTLAAMFVLALLGTFISTRLIILFPAIAVDAPRASFRNAYEDTQGVFWRIFGILVVTVLPVTIAGIVMFLLAGQSVVAQLIGAVLNMLNLAFAIAAASRLYLRLANWLGRPGLSTTEVSTA